MTRARDSGRARPHPNRVDHAGFQHGEAVVPVIEPDVQVIVGSRIYVARRRRATRSRDRRRRTDHQRDSR
jgi:hypothetical protein